MPNLELNRRDEGPNGLDFGRCALDFEFTAEYVLGSLEYIKDLMPSD